MENEINKENKKSETKENIENLKPEKIKFPFLKEETGNKWYYLWLWGAESHIVQPEEIKGTTLFLLKNDMTIDPIQQVKSGIFKLKTGNEEKEIALTPERIYKLNYGNQQIPVWIAHEDNMYAYPQDPIMSATFFRRIIQRITLNYKDINEAKLLELQNKRMWIWIVGGGLILILLWVIARSIMKGDVASAQNAINTTANITAVVTGIPL